MTFVTLKNEEKSCFTFPVDINQRFITEKKHPILYPLLMEKDIKCYIKSLDGIFFQMLLKQGEQKYSIKGESVQELIDKMEESLMPIKRMNQIDLHNTKDYQLYVIPNGENLNANIIARNYLEAIRLSLLSNTYLSNDSMKKREKKKEEEKCKN